MCESKSVNVVWFFKCLIIHVRVYHSLSSQLYKAKSSKELWAFLFNDFLLLTYAAKQFTSSGLDKLFSNKNNVQLKIYKPVRDAHE